MRVEKQPDHVGGPNTRIVLAIGFFDGVHKGHQAVITAAREAAREHQAQPWVLTFEPHPLKIVKPESAPPLLTTLPHKLRLLNRMGVAGCCVMEFNEDLRRVRAEDFVKQLVSSVRNLKAVVVGTNWRFGRNHAGDTTLLQKMAGDFNLSVTTVKPVFWEGAPVSSTRIRQSLRHGALADVEAMLGHPFSVYGDVVHGHGIGKELGFPTANVDPHNEVHPPPGIYAGYVLLNRKKYKAAIYIGTRPTFDQPAKREQFVVEVYLLDVKIDLYKEDLEVFLLEKIRDDERFTSKETLRRQIEKDVRDTRQLLQRYAGH